MPWPEPLEVEDEWFDEPLAVGVQPLAAETLPSRQYLNSNDHASRSPLSQPLFEQPQSFNNDMSFKSHRGPDQNNKPHKEDLLSQSKHNTPGPSSKVSRTAPVPAEELTLTNHPIAPGSIATDLHPNHNTSPQPTDHLDPSQTLATMNYTRQGSPVPEPLHEPSVISAEERRAMMEMARLLIARRRKQEEEADARFKADMEANHPRPRRHSVSLVDVGRARGGRRGRGRGRGRRGGGRRGDGRADFGEIMAKAKGEAFGGEEAG